MPREQLRTLQELVADKVLPELTSEGFAELSVRRSKRNAAVKELLCTLDEASYRQIVNKVNSLIWFLPDLCLWGLVSNRSGTMKYITPVVEFAEFSLPAVIGLVAHELAHFFLGHGKPVNPGDDEYRQQEEEAGKLVADWGLQDEAAAFDREVAEFMKQLGPLQ
jgi:hypothetical protein